MKNPVVFAIAIIVFLPFVSQAQKNFQPGTIVLKSGEPVEGEIDYKNWEINPTKIRFRANRSAETVIYTPRTLRSFSVMGERYESAVVEIDRREDKVSKLSYNGDIDLYTDTVFLNLVVNGDKALYHYFDNVHHFYIRKDDGFELLKFKKFIVPNGDEFRNKAGESIKSVRGYIGQLTSYLGSCERVKGLLANTEYRLDALKSVFNEYYSCAGISTEYVRKKDKTKMELSLIAGASAADLTVVMSRPGYTTMDYKTSVNFAGGISFDLLLPRNRSRFSINSELIYTSYQTEGTSRVPITPTRYEEDTYTFDYSYVKLNLIPRYRFLLENTTLYVNAGISYGLAVKKESIMTHVHRFDDTKDVRVRENPLRRRNNEYGILGGAGVRRGRVSVEVRVERGNGMMYALDTRSAVMRYFGLLGVRIL